MSDETDKPREENEAILNGPRIDGDWPAISVKRGGPTFPKPGEPGPWPEQVAAYERDRAAQRAAQLKRHKERQGTLRVLGTLSLVVLVLLAMMNALPWQ